MRRRSLRPRTSSEKQRRPQCDSTSDAECHPLLEGYAPLPRREVMNDESELPPS